MKRIVMMIVVTGAVLVSATAFAGRGGGTVNGTSLNGTSVNGKSVNGGKYNGSSLNGGKYNGTEANANTVLVLKGVHADHGLLSR
jgi:uncharacterized membrane protein